MSRQCWAREIGGCSEEMSKDHPVSAQLLPGGAIVEGFPWLGGEPMAVGLNSLGVRCLCKKHNSDLSPLDDAAGQLSRDLDDFIRVSAVRRRYPGRRTWSLHYWEQSGVRLERWCGKFLCTTLAGGLYTDPLPEWTPPLALVRFVFGRGELSSSAGLFMRGRPGDVRTNDNVWGIRPMGLPSNIEGAAITFRALRFYFLPFVTTPRPPSQAEIDGVKEDMMHHPRSVNWAGLNLELRFKW